MIFTLYFYLSDYYCFGQDDGSYDYFLSTVSKQLDLLDPCGLIQVSIDSSTAHGIYQKHFTREIKVLPFPHAVSFFNESLLKTRAFDESKIRLTYCGYPKKKYGFHLILELLKRKNEYNEFDDIIFEIKINPDIEDAGLLSKWEECKQNSTNLIYHEGYLDDDEYKSLLQRSDILLIPYGSQYKHDTSALLVDGLSNNCVIVSASGTWMESIYKEYGSGLSYNDEDFEDFIVCLKHILSDFPNYSAKADDNIDSLNQLFSSNSLFRHLFPQWQPRITNLKSNNYTSHNSEDLSRIEIIFPPTYLYKQEQGRLVDIEECIKKINKLHSKLLEEGVDEENFPSKNIAFTQQLKSLELIANVVDNKEKYTEQILKLKKGYSKKSCFVIGPDMPIDEDIISIIKNETIIVAQQGYRQFEANYDCVDHIIMETKEFVNNREIQHQLEKFKNASKWIPYKYIASVSNSKKNIFFNHIPRASYPHDYDISNQAQNFTYTSCTTIGTALQIALSLEFKTIYLLGINVRQDHPEIKDLLKFYKKFSDKATSLGVSVQNLHLDTDIPFIERQCKSPISDIQKRSKLLLDSINSGDHKIQYSLKELEILEKELLKKHPCPSDIYLPTTKYTGLDRINSIQKVVNIWNKNVDMHKARLRNLKDRFKGVDRCFIIGNGPSINKTDLNLLKNEVSFATNGIFLKFPDTDFRPTIYVVEDHLVGEDRYEEINNLEIEYKLAPFYLAYCLEEDENVIYYNHRSRVSYPHGFDFSTNAEEITYTGCTVTFSCMQLAYYMGFKEIYLVGVDMSYQIPEKVKKMNEYDTEILDMDFDDPNHFASDYFGRGYRWHDPNVDKMEEAYKEARKVTEQNNVKIFNATIGGECEVFDRVNYQSLFSDSNLNQNSDSSCVYPIDNNESSISHTLQKKFKLLSSVVTSNISAYNELNLDFLIECTFRESIRLYLFTNAFKYYSQIKEKNSNIFFDKFKKPIKTKSILYDNIVFIYFDIIAGQGLNHAEFYLCSDLGVCKLKPHNFRITSFQTKINKPFPLSEFDGIKFAKRNPKIAQKIMSREYLSALHYYLENKNSENLSISISNGTKPTYGWRHEISEIN